MLFKCSLTNSESAKVYEGHIEDKCTQMVYIRLSKDCVKDLNLRVDTDIMVQAQFVLNRLPFCEWHKAVDSLPDVGLVFLMKKDLEDKETNIMDVLNQDSVAFAKNWSRLILELLLNTHQKKAIAVMTTSSDITIPPVLLLGPFGTGKTNTIAEALRNLLTNSSKHKILLCTHSNSAADLYVKEFFDGWYKAEKCPQLKPVRVLYKGRAKNTVRLPRKR